MSNFSLWDTYKPIMLLEYQTDDCACMAFYTSWSQRSVGNPVGHRRCAGPLGLDLLPVHAGYIAL